MICRTFNTLLMMLVMAFSIGAYAEKPMEKPTEKPKSYPDGTWLNIDGTVDRVGPNMFVLDYGEGNITVEMDDVDRDADAYALKKGDKVRVSGMVDDDLYESATIEAGSVYVENIGTTFHADAMKEEDSYLAGNMPVVVSRGTVQGRITIVADDSFTLDTDDRKLTVKVNTMPYDPLDNAGYQQLKVGDYVSVTGAIQRGFFDHKILKATSVTTFFDGSKPRTTPQFSTDPNL